MAEGEAKGEKNKSIEIAKNMLKENVEKKLISKVTGLSLEEIKNLKQKYHKRIFTTFCVNNIKRW